MRQGLIAIVAVVFAGALASGVPAVNAQSSSRVDQVSAISFGQTVQQVKTAIQSKGQMILATFDHQNMLQMLGVKSNGATAIEFGQPSMLKTFFVPNPEIGLDVPLRIYVWQRQDGKTVVSYYKVGPIFASYGKQNLTMAGQMMDKLLAEITAAGTR